MFHSSCWQNLAFDAAPFQSQKLHQFRFRISVKFSDRCYSEKALWFYTRSNRDRLIRRNTWYIYFHCFSQRALEDETFLFFVPNKSIIKNYINNKNIIFITFLYNILFKNTAQGLKEHFFKYIKSFLEKNPAGYVHWELSTQGGMNPMTHRK